MRFNYWQDFEEGYIYHIYNKGVNGEFIYLNDENMMFFLDKFKELICPYFDIIAYCLMNNHFHFLARVKEIDEKFLENIKEEVTSKSILFLEAKVGLNNFLADQFRRLFLSYALAFNKQNDREGSLFKNRFKHVRIKKEHKLFYLITYLHHNPIHHLNKSHYEDWKFSSYKAFLSNNPSIIIKDETLSWYHQDIEEAKLLFLKEHEEFKISKQKDKLDLD